jgi:outer membrane protein TolC
MERAEGALRLAERESAAMTASAVRERTASNQRVERDRALLADAERVVTLSSRAYEEGAFPLSSVIEAQRVAREVRSSYIDDVVAARVADADFSLATGTWTEP